MYHSRQSYFVVFVPFSEQIFIHELFNATKLELIKTDIYI